MRKRLLYTTLLAAILLSFIGCKSMISDGAECEECMKGQVHMIVNIKALGYDAGSTRSESINTDATYYEDAVHSLAMVIFKSADGSKVGTFFNDGVGSGVPATVAFKIQLLAGEYDFYFVANMPNMATELNAITSRAAMDAYISKSDRQLDATLYEGASSTKGFPMARVYLKQNLAQGGTVYQPKPFKPKMHSNELDKVVVNTTGGGATQREWVELIRAVAKLEVEVASGNVGVSKIFYRNANRHFRLKEFETQPTTYFNDNAADVELKKVPGTANKWYYYMPAVFRNSGAPFNETAHNKPTNYFTIVADSGQKINIPIISNNPAPTAVNYLAFAKKTHGTNGLDLSIYRNRRYVYTLKIDQQIEVIYNVHPWEVVKRSTYMGYGYIVDVDSDGHIKITNTMDDCMPHKIRLIAKNGASFTMGGSTSTNEIVFGFDSDTDPGFAPAKLKAQYSETFQVNSNSVAADQPYIEVYYNKEPGAGVKPDKVFVK